MKPVTAYGRILRKVFDSFQRFLTALQIFTRSQGLTLDRQDCSLNAELAMK